MFAAVIECLQMFPFDCLEKYHILDLQIIKSFILNKKLVIVVRLNLCFVIYYLLH